MPTVGCYFMLATSLSLLVALMVGSTGRVVRSGSPRWETDA